MTQTKSWVRRLGPVMLAFFAMSFVDCIGVSTNYVKESFSLSNSVANLCPSMVFFWFFVCSVPTGLLMNKIGRRKTVLLSLLITALALLLPFFNYRFAVMMISFTLLGIGNAIMQVSLNPLLSNIISKDKLASMMTLGQFVKAVGSFLAPVAAAWFATYYQKWFLLYGFFAVEAILAFVSLMCEKIQEETCGETTSFTKVFRLLGDKTILLFFVAIMCHVGIDVGINISAPQIFMERLEWPLSRAVYASSIYFMFRTMGCLCGVFLLAKYSAKKVFAGSVSLMLMAMCGLFLFREQWAMYMCLALIGLGNANIFPVIFSRALLHLPQRKNEVSSLMIMGLIGGTLFPLLIGLLCDGLHTQTAAVAVMAGCAVYLCFIIRQIKPFAV